MGFKEIEVGFPSASQPDFDFVRQLIEEDLHPRRRDDPGAHPVPPGADRAHVREHRRRVEGDRPLLQLDQPAAARGRVRPRQAGDHRRRRQRRQAVPQARARRWATPSIRYEYSPESFTLTEPDFAIEICEAVMDVVEPTPDNPIILNLPATVECYSPNVYGDVIEWFGRTIKHRDAVVISPAPAQRPWMRGRRRRVRRDGRRRPRRGHAVRQRRAHRQRRRRQPGDEPVHERRRPRTRHQRHRRACAARPSTATGCRCIRAIRTSATSCTPRSPAATRTRSRRASTHSTPAATHRATTTSGACRTCRSTRTHVGRIVRGGDPGQQPVGQGRRGLRDEDRARLRPAPPVPDRVLQDDPAHHRGLGHRDHARRDVGRVPRRVHAGRAVVQAAQPRAAHASRATTAGARRSRPSSRSTAAPTRSRRG